jgi:hypothetical protein
LTISVARRQHAFSEKPEDRRSMIEDRESVTSALPTFPLRGLKSEARGQRPAIFTNIIAILNLLSSIFDLFSLTILCRASIDKNIHVFI